MFDIEDVDVCSESLQKNCKHIRFQKAETLELCLTNFNDCKQHAESALLTNMLDIKNLNFAI